MEKIQITDKILSYIKEKNKYVNHFEITPKIGSEWYIERIVSYPNVCCGEKLVELINEKDEWLRIPLKLCSEFV